MKKTITLLLSLLLLFLPGCGRRIQVENYVNYVCYDNLLTSTAMDGQKMKSTVLERGKREYRVTYRLLPNISDDQMVFMSVTQMLTPIQRFIMQNPENYIDVWRDWTIESIELYYMRMIHPSTYNSYRAVAQKPDKVISSTNDEDCIADFLQFITDANYEGESDTSDLLMTDREFFDQYRLYVRVHFHESSSVVWDSMCYSYNKESLPSRVIRLEKGYDSNDLLQAGTRRITIKDDSLYNWLCEAIDTIYA